MEKNFRTAPYKIVAENSDGRVFRFFCESSGAAVHTTKPIRADTESEALKIAWESEGKAEFNKCHACGKYVYDAMYNADVHNCVDCTPWEDPPQFCSKCGSKTLIGDNFCRRCGTRLMYGGEADDDKAV